MRTPLHRAGARASWAGVLAALILLPAAASADSFSVADHGSRSDAAVVGVLQAVVSHGASILRGVELGQGTALQLPSVLDRGTESSWFFDIRSLLRNWYTRLVSKPSVTPSDGGQGPVVPEPGAALVFAAGMALVARRMRRRRA